MAQSEQIKPKHPEIIINLTGQGGNTWAVLGGIFRAARRQKLKKEEVDAFMAEAQAGEMQHLLRTCLDWFSCQ